MVPPARSPKTRSPCRAISGQSGSHTVAARKLAESLFPVQEWFRLEIVDSTQASPPGRLLRAHVTVFGPMVTQQEGSDREERDRCRGLWKCADWKVEGQS